MSDVVIAFAAEDRGAAKSCGEYLARLGFKVDYGTPAARRSRTKAPLRPEIMAARAVVVIWSEATARLRALHQEAEVAAATGRLVGVHVKANPPARLAGDLQSFIVGSVSEPQHVAAALAALGVPFRVANGNGEDHVANLPDEAALAERAWVFADGRGDPLLIHHYMRRFPSPENATRARRRLAELAGADEPDGDTNRPLKAMLGVLCAVAVMVGLFFALVPQRAIEEVHIAAAGSDGAYRRMVENYNEYLLPYGIQLKVFGPSKTSFGNVQSLVNGAAPLAFVKGGFAGALRDPEFMTDARLKRNAEGGVSPDWSRNFGNFQSLGRVAHEPLWVFTYGSSERNRISDFNREIINIGSVEGGTRTLVEMLLQHNKVRYQAELWLDKPIAPDRIDDKKPLQEARALFLLQPGETRLVQALLKRVAPEKQNDEASIIRSADFSADGKRIAVSLGDHTARIWDAKTGKELVVLRGHTDEVNDAVFSPDDKIVATASDDNTVGIWDSADGQAHQAPHHFQLRYKQRRFPSDRRQAPAGHLRQRPGCDYRRVVGRDDHAAARPQRRCRVGRLQRRRQEDRHGLARRHSDHLGRGHRPGDPRSGRARRAGDLRLLQPRRQDRRDDLLGQHGAALGCGDRPVEAQPEGPRGRRPQRPVQPRRQIDRHGLVGRHSAGVGCSDRHPDQGAERLAQQRHQRRFQPRRQARHDRLRGRQCPAVGHGDVGDRRHVFGERRNRPPARATRTTAGCS